MSSAPVQLANRLPVAGDNDAGTARLSSQRAVAPSAAPMERGMMLESMVLPVYAV